MDRIVALIDASPYSKSVSEHAAWVAAKTGFDIDLLHVVPHRPSSDAPINLTGNLTLGARSELLEKLSRHDEEAAQLARERGRVLVDAANRWTDNIFEVRKRLKEKGPVTIPREFVFMDRAAIGLGAAYLRLRAELNFHQLFEESLEGFSEESVTARQAEALSRAGLSV